MTHNSVIHFSDVSFKLIDSEFRQAADELVTVVVNMADIPELNNARSNRKRAAVQPHSKAKDSSHFVEPEAKIKQSSVNEDTNYLEEIKSSGASTNSSDSPLPKSGSHYGRYNTNEMVFIQEGGDCVNRRIHPRRESRWPTLVTLKDNQTIECITKDLSEHGFSLMSSVSLQLQSIVKVNVQTFYKGRSRDLSILGIVKHSLLATNGFIVGVQIKQCTQNCNEFIAKYSTHQI